jgi:SAM-dependent methyltransferase
VPTPIDPTGYPDVMENTYGSRKRLDWILSQLHREDVVVEVGCGTGSMITLPLVTRGVDAYGSDLDEASIEYGRRLCQLYAIDPVRLAATPLEQLAVRPTVVVASEVLEHIHDEDLGRLLAIIRECLPSGGRLLITVPNGYGWAEMESRLWWHFRLGRFIETLHLPGLLGRLKRVLLRRDVENPYPNTLADDSSPHVQRFTLTTIQSCLQEHGFRIQSAAGSVMFAGPFSNMLLTGFGPLMRANNWLGGRFPRVASGFFVVAEAARDD